MTRDIMAMLIFLWLAFPAAAQENAVDSTQAVQADSITLPTPFAKGKWISGLGGRFGTATADIDASGDKSFTNSYGLNFRTGKFIADRWVVGLAIDFSRISSSALVDDESDFFQVGPFVRFYASPNPNGSVFMQTGFGYAKFREKAQVSSPNFNLNTVTDGDGLGIAVGLGYAFMVSKTVAFDIGLNYDFSFLDAEIIDLINNVQMDQNFTRGGTVFSFGFTVVLDEFFF